MASEDVVLRVQANKPRASPRHIVLSKQAAAAKDKEDLESASEDDPHRVQPGDFRQRQVFKGRVLLWLTYQSIGLVYGDIGTSPLYVYSSTFTSEPSHDDLLGILSLIIWSLTLVVSFKYVLVVLCANDEGEGGTFAIYSLLSRYSNIVRRDPKTENMVKLERHDSNEMKASNRGVRSFLERSRLARRFLKILAVFGISLLLSDSILTPAQSVLGAVQGIRVIDPSIDQKAVVGISCAILVLLFLMQPLGISRLAVGFSPLVIVWLLLNSSYAIYNLVQYDHTVLKAFSPYFAGDYFMRNKTDGWKALGGVLLCFTGVEALFADLGAFSKRAIQIGWISFTYPCLLLTYAGQAAYISRFPSAYSNPFFRSVPPHMIYPSLVLSILAAVIASQALITSTFQLLSQIMNTSYFPQLPIVYTSKQFHGQIYIPIANWLIMIGTVAVTAIYSDTVGLGHAYGFCVVLVTLITTSLIVLVALIVWRLHWAIILVASLPVFALDGLFVSVSASKVPQGAWFALVLASILASICTIWRYGKEKQWTAEKQGRIRMRDMLVQGENGRLRLKNPVAGQGELSNIRGMGIFFDKAGDRVPTVYEEFVRKFEAQPEVCVFLHLRGLSRPHVSEEERFTVSLASMPNCYRVTVRHGYNDRVVTEHLSEVVVKKIRAAIFAYQASEDPDRGATVARALASLDSSRLHNAVYIVGHPGLRLNFPRKKSLFFKRLVLNAFLWIRQNTRARITQWDLPLEKLVEVGFLRDIEYDMLY